jgi:alpha-glucosidase
MWSRRFRLLILFGAFTGAYAQEALHVTSPNRQLEFRLFVAEPEPGALPRIAYQVFDRGRRIMNTAFLGIDILDQEPILGENAGLIASLSGADPRHRYNWLIAEYMQNGSLGRRLNVEARAYDDGIAFRYVIPRSTPLTEILIAQEATEFQNTGGFTITEVRKGTYPAMRLERLNANEWVARLEHTPFQATAPLTCPWRVIVPGKESGILKDLNGS